MLPGVLLDATDRDILIGDWIYYSLSGNGSHLFSPSNITHRVYVIQPLTLPISKYIIHVCIILAVHVIRHNTSCYMLHVIIHHVTCYTS